MLKILLEAMYAIFPEWLNLPALTGHPVSSLPFPEFVFFCDLQLTLGGKLERLDPKEKDFDKPLL
jgi:hypothetical protein